jgi:hypothetical protein
MACLIGCGRYVKPGADYEVNISSSQQARVLKAVKAADEVMPLHTQYHPGHDVKGRARRACGPQPLRAFQAEVDAFW